MEKKKLLIFGGITLVIIIGLFWSGTGKVNRLSFATAGTGGTYFPMGGGVADFFTKKVDGVEVTAQTSGGSAENLRLIQNGDVDMAWANGSEIYWAWNGQKFFEDKEHDKVRIVPFAWTNTYHFAALEESSITSVEDFRGKKVGIGPQGSGAAIFGETYLKDVGLWDDIKPMYLPPADQSSSFKDGGIDVFGYFSGFPMAAMIDISSVRNIYLLDLQKLGDESGFTDKYPFYIRTNIPAGTYKGQTNNVGSYSNLTYWVASEDVSEDIIYRLVKELYSEEGLKHMTNVHRRSQELSTDKILNGVEQLDVPLHPGTIKFLNEKGIEVNDL
ncbi:MAG: TAXI family TRAP transporter solute-binding subunit [Halanaerobiales bacterium]